MDQLTEVNESDEVEEEKEKKRQEILKPFVALSHRLGTTLTFATRSNISRDVNDCMQKGLTYAFKDEIPEKAYFLDGLYYFISKLTPEDATAL